MVSVRDVLGIAELRLTLRTGDRPAPLDRPISRIYSTELPDPARFLSGGELVISGLLWLRTGADVPRFVAALAGAGVAALVACDADTGVIPAELITACREHGVPLLEGPVDLSFAVITERVGLDLAAQRVALGSGHRRLITALSRGGGITDLLRLGAEDLDAPCWVLTPVGRVVASAGPELSENQATTLVRAFLAGEGQHRLPGFAEPLALIPVDDPDGPDLSRWTLVVAAARDAATDELASLIGVQRAREREGRRLADRVVGTLLRSVLSGSARAADIVSGAQAAGLDAQGEVCVLALSLAGGPALATAVAGELVAVLHPRGLVGTVEDTVYLLLPVGPRQRAEAGTQLAERARTALHLLEPALPERRAVLGVSSVTSVVQLRGAVEEARHARRVGEQRADRITVVRSAEIAVHQLLLATMPDELRGALRRRVLGPVIDYDAEHGGSLVDTLTVFLDCAGSWARAASRLHVHVNTLRYRIGRIEELLGADLSDFTTRVDIYLALHARP